MNPSILDYHAALEPRYREIADFLLAQIELSLPDAEGKVWHRHPVWFLGGNPIVGYSVQKPGLRLMFWSGADFGEPGLNVVGAKFKDASVFYRTLDEVEPRDLERWLERSRVVQWDYKNIVRNRGLLARLVPETPTPGPPTGGPPTRGPTTPR